MKHIAKKTMAALLAFMLIFGLAAAAHASFGPGTKLVVLGDSIPAGEGATEEAKSYARLLEAQRGFALANYAVGGHASADLLAILADNEAAKQAIRDADIINLNIGGNDLLASNVITLVLRLVFLNDASIVEEYIEDFAVRFADIIEQILALNSDALFIVQTLPNVMGGIPLVGDAYDVAVNMLNQVYHDYLEANPGVYVIADVYSAFLGREGLVHRDRLHPSDAGHAMIAKVLTATIDGTMLELEPVEPFEPGFFQQAGIFACALVDYLSYWLSVMSVWQLISNIFRFMF